MNKKKPQLYDLSHFHGDTELTSDGKMEGLYSIPGGADCNYSLSTQKAGANYCVRGTISLLDPVTGRIFKIKNRLKAKRDTSSNDGGPPSGKAKPMYSDARIQLYSNSKDGSDLRRLIGNKACALYNDNLLLLLDASRKNVPLEQMPFPLAVQIYGNKYAEKKSPTSESAQHDRIQRLKKISQLILYKAIGDISLREVDATCKLIGSNWREYIQDASDFLDHAMLLKHESLETNVFTEYLARHPKGKQENNPGRPKDVANSDILSVDEERKLNHLIMSNINDGAFIALSLVKEGGLPAKDACNLTWNDLSFPAEFPGFILVKLHLDKFSSATHDYSFLLFPFAFQVLSARKKWLLEKGYSKRQIEQMPVASDPNDEKTALTSDELVRISRTVLRDCGVGYATLAALQEYQKAAGITLLHNTYQYRLNDVCLLKHDPAIVKYMRHQSLGNMLQADHYRSFNDFSARYHIATALSRDTRFESSQFNKKPIKKGKIGNLETIVVSSPTRQDVAAATFRLRLKPGQRINISSTHGCVLSIEATPAKKAS